MKYLTAIDLNNNEVQNAKVQNLGTDPAGLASGNAGRIWYNTTDNHAKVWNGSAVDYLTNVLETIAVDSNMNATVTGKQVSLSVLTASANTASKIVARDSSGNFSAGTITASLTGTASNATQLNSQAASFYLNFSNTTGQRDHTSISDFDTQVRSSRLDQMAAPTSSLSLNSQKIVSLLDPTSAQDAATKNYVDSVASGLDAKASVKAATTAALAANTYANGASGVGATLTANANGAIAAIDGYTPVLNDRLLIKNEATAANNGIYVVTQVGDGTHPYILTRATDANSSTNITSGLFTFIEQGTANAAQGWVLSTIGSITVGTTALNFSQFSAAVQFTAGNGLQLIGTAFSVVGTANRISVGASVDISASYVGQTSITTLGTITTGTWTGTTIAVANGGTGATSAANARSNLGAVGKASANVPAGTSYAFAHNLGTTDVDVSLKDTSSLALVQADYVVTDANTVTVSFASAVTANAFRITVIG